jgi:uncharacterized protein YjbI with pentapeptide repeats
MNEQRFKLNLEGAFLPRTDWSRTVLHNAVLSRANFQGASFRGSSFEGAQLVGTDLRGADLADAVNLTREQLQRAIIDETTVLPSYLTLDQVKSAA